MRIPDFITMFARPYFYLPSLRIIYMLYLIATSAMLLFTAHLLNTQPLTFRGIEIGATRQQIDSLVAHSRWSYPSQSKSPDTLLADEVCLRYDADDGSARDSFYVLACLDDYGYEFCIHFTSACITYYKGRVVHIAIESEEYDYQYPSLAGSGAKAIVHALRQRYGPATTTYRTLDAVQDESRLRRLTRGEVYTLAEWDIPAPSRKQKPQFSISTFFYRDNDGTCSISVNYYDTSGFAAWYAEHKRVKKHPAVKSGF